MTDAAVEANTTLLYGTEPGSITDVVTKVKQAVTDAVVEANTALLYGTGPGSITDVVQQEIDKRWEERCAMMQERIAATAKDACKAACDEAFTECLSDLKDACKAAGH